MDLIKIGQMISEKRKEKKLTQAQLGELLGISGKSVSKWERGINMPDIEKMNQLCSILEINLVDMLNGKVNDTGSNNSFRFNIFKKLKESKLCWMFVILLNLIVIIFLLTLHYVFDIVFVETFNQVLNLLKNERKSDHEKAFSTFDGSYHNFCLFNRLRRSCL